MPSHVLIVSPARAGSTSLRLTLNRQPNVLFHGEILGPNNVRGVSSKIHGVKADLVIRNNNRPRFISDLLDRDDFKVTGFKALYEHFFMENNAYYLNWILSRAPKVVFLWRRDLVRRFKSDCLLRFSKGHFSKDRLQAITERKITADAKRQMEMAGWILQILESYRSTHGVETMKVDFEDIVSDPTVSARVLEFAGLDPVDAKLSKDQRTAKNEDKKDPVEVPQVFEDMGASSRLADVSLEDALTWYTAGRGFSDR